MKKITDAIISRHITFIAILFLSLMISCKKKAGPPGPQGPQGNANVREIIFTNQSFTYNTTYSEYQMYLNVPAITQDIQNRGAVMVYMQPVGLNIYIALPYTDKGPINMGFTTSVGGIDLFANYNPDVANYKVVIIASN